MFSFVGSVPAIPVHPEDVISKTAPPSDPKQFSHCVGFDTELIALEKYFTWQADLERAKAYTPFFNKFYEPSIYRTEEVSGEETLLKVKQTVHSFFPKGRFPFQITLHQQILRATLRQTLGEDYERCVNRICEEHGWDGPKRNLFAIASRRSGKTTATASMVAALLICVPGIEIVVYSVGLRSAQEFVRLVERYIQMSDVGRDMIKNPGGSETLVLRGNSPGDIRRIRSFPSGGNAKNHTEPEQQSPGVAGEVEMQESTGGMQTLLEAVDAMEQQTPELQDVESVEEVIPLLDKFDEGLPNVGFERLYDYLLEFEAKIRALTKSLGPGRIPKGYVARQVSVSVMGHVCRILNDMFSKEHQLEPEDAVDFSIELASLLYKKQWGQSTYDVHFYDELLRPDGMPSGGAVIRPHIEQELRDKALKRVKLIEAQTNGAPDGIELANEYSHLLNVMSGNFPAPYNTSTAHRWLCLDVGLAVDPHSNLNEAFALFPEHVAYLDRLCNAIVAGFHANPEEMKKPENKEIIERIVSFVERRSLPPPWHIK